MAKPTSWREALPLVEAVYTQPNSGLGCCLHCIIEDDNVDDHFVESAIADARAKGHTHCLALALMLRDMSRTQRLKLSADGTRYHYA
jgi:hypothetical protein